MSNDDNTAITVGTSSSDNTTLLVALSVANGTLTLPTTAYLTFIGGTSNGGTTISFTGIADDINTALDGLEYTPNQDAIDSDSLAVTVSQSIFGSDTQITATVVVDIAVLAATVPSVSAPVDVSTSPAAALVFSTNAGNGISVSDSGSDGMTLTVTLSAEAGILTLSQTTNLTFFGGTGNGEQDLSFTGNASEINGHFSKTQWFATREGKRRQPVNATVEWSRHVRWRCRSGSSSCSTSGRRLAGAGV